MARSRRKRKPKLPRSPLPRQTGGAHRDQRKLTAGAGRRAKYRSNYHLMED